MALPAMSGVYNQPVNLLTYKFCFMIRYTHSLYASSWMDRVTEYEGPVDRPLWGIKTAIVLACLLSLPMWGGIFWLIRLALS